MGQQKYEENLAKGLINPQRKTGIVDSKSIFTNSTGDQSNMVTSSSLGTRSLGGKNRKRKITRKHRNKTYKNKTIKRSKKNKRNIKHRRR